MSADLVDLVIPAVGESVSEALVNSWLKKVGDYVGQDEPVVELETDKVTLELPAPVAGVIAEILAEEGATVNVGDIVGKLDPSAEAPAGYEAGPAAETPAESAAPAAAAAPAAPAGTPGGHVMPAAQRVLAQQGIDPATVAGTGPGGRVLKEDAQRAAAAPAPAVAAPPALMGSRQEERRPMSPMRRRIASNLVDAQQQAALLTTFNEADMSAIKAIRSSYQDRFVKKYDIKLGFMSFFVKAAIDGLRRCPQLNAEIDGTDIIYRDYYDIGIAVSTNKGLMVPVLRNAEQLGFAETEQAIADFGTRARTNKIKLDELSGGTFTISNGGIFGSLMSTPIVNPPQSGVLGLHAIQDRPVAVNGEIVIRPMMYLALTYDHRIVDGREAVTFLVRIKEAIENPERLLLEV